MSAAGAGARPQGCTRSSRNAVTVIVAISSIPKRTCGSLSRKTVMAPEARTRRLAMYTSHRARESRPAPWRG